MVMEIKELGHVVLFVRNLERSVHFYRDVLGFRPVERRNADGEAVPFGRVAMFSSGRTHHELFLIEVGEEAPHPGGGRRAGLYHLGLKIGESDDDLREALGVLRAEGVPVAGMSDHTVTHSLYLMDPDGNEIELYVDVPGVDWHDPENVLVPTKALAL
jgi:catechol-2,3-dioxygenase